MMIISQRRLVITLQNTNRISNLTLSPYFMKWYRYIRNLTSINVLRDLDMLEKWKNEDLTYIILFHYQFFSHRDFDMMEELKEWIFKIHRIHSVSVFALSNNSLQYIDSKILWKTKTFLNDTNHCTAFCREMFVFDPEMFWMIDI